MWRIHRSSQNPELIFFDFQSFTAINKATLYICRDSEVENMSKNGNRLSLRGIETVDWQTFKTALNTHNYSQTALAETLGLSGHRDRQDVEVVFQRVKEDMPYNLLVRLFWLGRSVKRQTMTHHVPEMDIDTLSETGLLDTSDSLTRSNVKFTPYHDLMLASDFGPEIHSDMPTDHVLGVGAASLTLAGLTVRKETDSALDLGCGAGFQAFLAANHCKHVVGTDINQKALKLAELNAMINTIDNIKWRNGSLFDPVAGEQFDLIVCNPPFVISPESKFIYRDASMPGDAVSEHVIRNASTHLNQQGFACILFNWHHKEDEDWSDRPMEWVSNTGCDAWLVCFKTAEPLVYAADWLKTSRSREPGEYARQLEEWLAYYEKMDIGRISAGVMIMRKQTDRANWKRADNVEDGRCIGTCSDQIQRVFAAEDMLRNTDDTHLLQQRLVFDGNHRLEHELHVDNGRWTIDKQLLRITRGIPFSGILDMHIAKLLAGCNGEQTVGQLIQAMARDMDSDPTEISSASLAVVRGLLRAGFLSVE